TACPLQGSDFLLAAEPRRRGGHKRGVQGFQRTLRIADQTDRGRIVAPNVRCVHVNLDHCLPTAELRKGQAGAYRQHGIPPELAAGRRGLAGSSNVMSASSASVSGGISIYTGRGRPVLSWRKASCTMAGTSCGCKMRAAHLVTGRMVSI